MRVVQSEQMTIDEVDVSKITFDPKSRDDIPKNLPGLQYVYMDIVLHDSIFNLLVAQISPNVDKSNIRSGITLWTILSAVSDGHIHPWSQPLMGWKCMASMSARTTASPNSSASWRWWWWPETFTGLVPFCDKGSRSNKRVISRECAGAMTRGCKSVNNDDRTSLRRNGQAVLLQKGRLACAPGTKLVCKLENRTDMRVRR
jgi:hypothetical protein